MTGPGDRTADAIAWDLLALARAGITLEPAAVTAIAWRIRDVAHLVDRRQRETARPAA